MDVVMPTDFINPSPFKVSVLAYGCASAVGVLQCTKMHFRISQGIVQDSRSEVHLGGGCYLVFRFLFHWYNIPHKRGLVKALWITFLTFFRVSWHAACCASHAKLLYNFLISILTYFLLRIHFFIFSPNLFVPLFKSVTRKPVVHIFCSSYIKLFACFVFVVSSIFVFHALFW